MLISAHTAFNNVMIINTDANTLTDTCGQVSAVLFWAAESFSGWLFELTIVHMAHFSIGKPYLRCRQDAELGAIWHFLIGHLCFGRIIKWS